MAGILYIISAPSGSGKSTIVNKVRSMARDLEFSISYTTRAPRGSEQEGLEYHFVTVEEFRRMIAADEFLEYAEVFGNYYGTSRRSLTDAKEHGHDLLLDIDVQGAQQVRSRMPEAVSIFILPPTPEVLETRLRNRSRAEGNLDQAVIDRRLAKSKHEIENYSQYGYILVNDVLDVAVEELFAIVEFERLARTGSHDSRVGDIHANSAASQMEGIADWSRLKGLALQCTQAQAEDRLRPVLHAFGLLPGEDSAAVPIEQGSRIG